MEANVSQGNVFWITGLSGAGKTTIGRELYFHLKSHKNNIVWLDGDELRRVFGNDMGYTKEERLTCAMRYSKMCQLLSDQGIDVIICTISMFNSVREWNRINIKNYIELYIKVPMEILQKRDQKGLYSGIDEGVAENVVGKDLQLELPQNPDYIIINDGTKSPEQLVDYIMKKMFLELHL